jgi:hypothetical protein
VVFPIYTLGSFWKIQKMFDNGLGLKSAPTNSTRLVPPKIGDTDMCHVVRQASSMPESVADSRDPPRPSLSPPPI